jgi:N-acetylglutamate synthase-like GNAT family acetyltransferase
LLRPATAADQPQIQQLLKNLEKEMSAVAALPSWLPGGVLVSLLLPIAVYGWLVPEARSFLQLLLAAIGIVVLLVVLGTLLLLQQAWQYYWVIEYRGYLVACAKLQRYSSYSTLFDLYVVPDWRRQGVGSHFVSFLAQQATKPLYLACLPARLPFYQRLGFAQVSPRRLPTLLQYDLGLPTRPGIIPMMLGS